MQAPIKYFSRKRSRTYSIRAEKRKQRLLKNREKIGRPIETDSRRKYWSKYFPDYRRISESLEANYRSNGGFIDRMEIHKEYLVKKNTTYPFRLVKRGLSDEAYSVLGRLLLYDEEARIALALGEGLSRKYPDLISVLAE